MNARMQLSTPDFCELLGVTQQEFPTACKALAENLDFGFDLPDQETRDLIILEVLRHLESDKPTRVGEQRADIWERCWAENLRRFVDGSHDPDKLLPEFIRSGQPVRLRQQFAIPRKPGFEASFLKVVRTYLFDRYFRNVEAAYEFGCGSGFNLVALAEQFPGKRLHGLDWSKSSNNTVNLLRGKLGLDISGRQFDFFRPDPSLQLEKGCGVLTMCALEQVGLRHRAFVDYLLGQQPAICVHMEPLLELYDENCLIDHLAVRYHCKRGYLTGFLAYLRELADAGRIRIIDTRRMYFGSLYHEGYSFVVWQPAISPVN